MELKVNDAEWASLGKEDQGKINTIVTGFFKNAVIVPDPMTAPSNVNNASLGWSTPFCKKACDFAESAASAACLALANPIAIAACIAATKIAGDACRRSC